MNPVAERTSQALQPLPAAAAGHGAAGDPGADRQPGAPAAGIDVFAAANVALRRWRALVGIPLLFALLAAATAFLIPPSYSATAAFVPEEDSGGRVPAGLAGLVGQFGITLGNLSGGRSVEFYSEAVKSRDILSRVLLSRYADYRTPAPDDSATLLAQLRVSGDSAEQFDKALKALRKATSVEADLPTNIVRVTVETPYAGLSAAAANRFVAFLDEYNTGTRRSHAQQRRAFVEQRLAEAEGGLRQAEEALEDFYRRNRTWNQSPQLQLEEARIRRRVDVRQEVYLTLSREFETARIQEVNDAPVISTFEHAVPPRERTNPKRALIVLLGAVLGVLVAVCWVVSAETTARLRAAGGEGYREFAARMARLGRRRGPRADQVARVP